ncbi:hypothetical protein N7451_012079 [Penicillium sp. IBT 35674x]|nr:hypothetical protein N7451_012079 [Penicillium sp. IBT 35674x]
MSSFSLTVTAKALRRRLAAWAIGLATEGEDYIINTNGSRNYDTATVDPLILLLLEEMGLDGYRYRMGRYSAAHRILSDGKVYLIPVHIVKGMPQILDWEGTPMIKHANDQCVNFDGFAFMQRSPFLLPETRPKAPKQSLVIELMAVRESWMTYRMQSEYKKPQLRDPLHLYRSLQTYSPFAQGLPGPVP